MLYSNSRPFSTPRIITPIILIMKHHHENPFYVFSSLCLEQLKHSLLHQVSKLFLILLFVLIFRIAACLKMLRRNTELPLFCIRDSASHNLSSLALHLKLRNEPQHLLKLVHYSLIFATNVLIEVNQYRTISS